MSKTEPVGLLTVQVHMIKTENEDDEVEKFCNIIEKIHE
jgi:hypothetical protein